LGADLLNKYVYGASSWPKLTKHMMSANAIPVKNIL